MEYYVSLPKLLECMDRLEQTARKERQILSELRDTVERLKLLSYMEEVIRELRRREERLEEQLQATLRMAQALRRIHELLLRMENAVVDGIELPALPQMPTQTKTYAIALSDPPEISGENQFTLQAVDWMARESPVVILKPEESEVWKTVRGVISTTYTPEM